MAKTKKSSACCCPSMDKDYQADDDARTLTRAEEVRQDGKRHTAACKKLKEQARVAEMEAKVKKGLASAFPKGEH
jgi:hypothetical protein